MKKSISKGYVDKIRDTRRNDEEIKQKRKIYVY